MGHHPPGTDRPRVGQPSLLELEWPDLAKRIARHVAKGNFLSVAAKSEGVDARTVKKWLQLGRVQDGDHADIWHRFAKMIDYAEAWDERQCLERIARASTSKVAGDPAHDWRHLTLRYPSRWGPNKGVSKVAIHAKMGFSGGLLEFLGKINDRALPEPDEAGARTVDSYTVEEQPGGVLPRGAGVEDVEQAEDAPEDGSEEPPDSSEGGT